MCPGEIADDLGFGFGKRRRTPIGIASRGAKAAPAAAPLIAKVTIQIHAKSAVAVIAAVFTPQAKVRATNIIFGAIGIEGRNNPDIALVDEIGDLAIEAVVLHQIVDQKKRLFDGEMFAGVGVGENENGFFIGFVCIRLIGDAQSPDISLFDGFAQADQAHDVGVLSGNGVDIGHHLVVIVIVFKMKGEIKWLQ